MHLELLVEELSAEKLLDNLLPKLVTGEHTYKIITHQGKTDLLNKLPTKLKGYKRYIKEDTKIIILVDRDSEDCVKLKKLLEKHADDAGLITKSKAKKGFSFCVLNRIAIEELESWFFGDAEAVRSAYPKVSQSFEKKSQYRNPDAILGGTWEALERVLQKAGYFKSGLRKTEAAYEISRNMSPLKNRSKSFQVFWNGITECLG